MRPKKPTYEELEQMVEKLTKEACERKQAGEEINCYDNAPMESSRHHRTQGGRKCPRKEP